MCKERWHKVISVINIAATIFSQSQTAFSNKFSWRRSLALGVGVVVVVAFRVFRLVVNLVVYCLLSV